MVIKLERAQSYNRKEIHDIFSPDTIFTPQAGTWGLHGIVKVPNRSKDYVFLVTFERRQGSYQFEESVSESGVLTWQSQPAQTLTESRIIDFINHNHLENNIYLFLRTHRNLSYTYLGKLAYLDHDRSREKPVHFKWQVLDWEYNDELLQEMKLILVRDGLDIENIDNLSMTEKPVYISEKSKLKREFKGKVIDFADNEEKNRELGLLGEKLVVESEKRWLEDHNRADLAEKVIHVSEKIGDGTGFDILSFGLDGSKKYIEVKTTRGGIGTPFYISTNEYEFAKLNYKNFFLYRLYNYRDSINSAYCFQLSFMDLSKLKREPNSFKVYPQDIV
ncbi:DUF3427 domain-containing protein [Metabacillus fastidiosus]|uniref:DUF3427 domain-containing protein n=1 Tax=Metabacillus fastidiosus TaxID=1458 RepID=UPI0008246A45|nr:DUF3427 domain-containing protein [Metabacillus fastidiosus]MED4461840.1 DUF3427 domain-containing protein [Metabacillus fastidiosus]